MGHPGENRTGGGSPVELIAVSRKMRPFSVRGVEDKYQRFYDRNAARERTGSLCAYPSYDFHGAPTYQI